jgi:REP element-mobilizing transposase RayT
LSTPFVQEFEEIDGTTMANSLHGSRSRTRRSNSARQLTIVPRGGARPGAGRKPKGERALVSHAKRTAVTPREPALITTKLVAGLPNVRRESSLAVLREALAAGADRFGFRLVECSVQTNHLHLVADAQDARAIARGMQGLLVRVAKALNRLWGRRGTVLADRYHARILRTPREVRQALVYVLQNARKHGARITGIDACSSGPWFGGWRDRVARAPSPIAAARSWLLTRGWRRGGLISTSECPAFGRGSARAGLHEHRRNARPA